MGLSFPSRVDKSCSVATKSTRNPSLIIFLCSPADQKKIAPSFPLFSSLSFPSSFFPFSFFPFSPINFFPFFLLFSFSYLYISTSLYLNLPDFLFSLPLRCLISCFFIFAYPVLVRAWFGVAGMWMWDVEYRAAGWEVVVVQYHRAYL